MFIVGWGLALSLGRRRHARSASTRPPLPTDSSVRSRPTGAARTIPRSRPPGSHIAASAPARRCRRRPASAPPRCPAGRVHNPRPPVPTRSPPPPPSSHADALAAHRGLPPRALPAGDRSPGWPVPPSACGP